MRSPSLPPGCGAWEKYNSNVTAFTRKSLDSQRKLGPSVPLNGRVEMKEILRAISGHS